MNVGYARVSTLEQNFDLQIDALNKIACEKIFRETVSGAKSERMALNKALKFLRKNDVLVVWRLDRLGRSLKDLIEIINELSDRNIGFISIVERIDTSSPTGKFFFYITGAFAELERNLIRERTMAGLKAARARGRKGGRPKTISPETFGIALGLYNKKEKTVSEICNAMKIKNRTFYNYLKRFKSSKK